MPKSKVQPPYLPFLDHVDVEQAADRTWVVRGSFDGVEERPVLLRLGEERMPFQDDHALEVCAEAAGASLLQVYRQGWQSRNNLGNRLGQLRIDYDEGNMDPATSYRAVLVTVGGETMQFATGAPVDDMQAAMAWAARNTAQVMTTSSVDLFVSDVAGFRFDEHDCLQLDPSDTIESRRIERAAEEAEEAALQPEP